MPKKLTTEEFIIKSNIVHNTFYRYRFTKYVNYQTKVTITCPVHGNFKQNPNHHLSGKGCQKCGSNKSINKRYLTTEQFVQRAKQVHGDKYDYSKVNYINTDTKVTIICKNHGNFKQIPKKHLQDQGCKKCATEKTGKLKRINYNEFILKANEIHNNKYSYLDVNYTKLTGITKISCKKHGEFRQRGHHHLNGQGCPICAKEITTLKITKTTEQFITEAVNIHGDKYDYSKTVYKGAHEKVKIICTEHGIFSKAAEKHLKGGGCQKCARTKQDWSYSTWQKMAENSKNFDSFKVYIIKCWNENEEFYKIGKTYTTIKQRFKSNFLPYNYEVIKIFEGDSRYISELEHKLQTENNYNKYIPLKEFGGMYECFKNINN